MTLSVAPTSMTERLNYLAVQGVQALSLLLQEENPGELLYWADAALRIWDAKKDEPVAVQWVAQKTEKLLAHSDPYIGMKARAFHLVALNELDEIDLAQGKDFKARGIGFLDHPLPLPRVFMEKFYLAASKACFFEICDQFQKSGRYDHRVAIRGRRYARQAILGHHFNELDQETQSRSTRAEHYHHHKSKPWLRLAQFQLLLNNAAQAASIVQRSLHATLQNEHVWGRNWMALSLVLDEAAAAGLMDYSRDFRGQIAAQPDHKERFAEVAAGTGIPFYFKTLSAIVKAIAAREPAPNDPNRNFGGAVSKSRIEP